MTRPARLRYEDSNGDTQIIGVLNTDSTQSDIDGLQLKNSGSGEYTRMEVTGDSDLLSAMPVNKNSFNDPDEPEIFLDVYSTNSDSFVTRDRVFAEKKGTIESDDGNYRNDQLYGFQKWVGRQKVDNLGPINSDVAGIISTALSNVPGNYTVETAGTIPSVQNYTYTGRIDSLIRDVQRDYPNVKIWWTADTSSGDYIVRVEEAGAGSTVETITFPDPDYQLIEYEPEDTTNVVNRVIVKGTDGNGNKIEVDTDNFTSGTLATDISNSKDKYGETTIERNIGYLQDTSHAQEIAKNLLELEAQPHLKVALPFQEQNVLNASVDITDDRYGIDGVYKVVKQRDFFKDSRTEVELSFEKNASEDRRGQDRDVGEERASLFPNNEQDVGNQSVSTGDAESNTGKTGGVGDSNDRDNDLSNVNKTGGVGDSGDRSDDFSNVAKIGGVNREDAITSLSSDQESRSNVSISGSSWTQVSILGTSNVTALYNVYRIGIYDISSSVNWLKIVISDDSEGSGNVLWMDTISNAGDRTFTDGAGGFNQEMVYEKTIVIPESGSTARTSSHYLNFSASSNVDVDFNWSVFEISHEHLDDVDTDNQAMGLTDNVDTDNNSMGLTDDVDTVDNLHGGGSGSDQHGGSTEDNVNVNILNQDKTDR